MSEQDKLDQNANSNEQVTKVEAQENNANTQAQEERQVNVRPAQTESLENTGNSNAPQPTLDEASVNAVNAKLNEDPSVAESQNKTVQEQTERVLPAQEKKTGGFTFKVKKAVDQAKQSFKKKKKKPSPFASTEEDHKDLSLQKNLKFVQKDFAEAFKHLCRRENLKKALSSKPNLALSLSTIALVLAMCSAINSCSAHKGISQQAKFVQLNANPVIEGNVAPNTSFNQPTTEDLSERGKPEPKTMTFADEREFKAAVAHALAQLKDDQQKALMQAKFRKYKDAPKTTSGNQKIYGNINARFKIYEFSDIECPYCKDAFPMPKQLADLARGKVNVEWINFPLSFHDPVATNEAMALECTFEQKGNQAYWVGLDSLFETTRSNKRGSHLMQDFAKYMDLDQAKYDECMKSPKTKEKINKNIEFANTNGINSTPTFMVLDTKTGEQRVVGNSNNTSDEIMGIIEEMFAKDGANDTDTSANSNANAPKTAEPEIAAAPSSNGTVANDASDSENK